MTPLWPPQQRAVDLTLAAVARGRRRIALTLPTGLGKTRVAGVLAKGYLDRGEPVILYTDRKALLEQLSAVIGLEHGVRAAGHQDQREMPFQVSSLPTENSRVLRKGYGAWELHPAKLVLVDEAHRNVGKVAREIVGRHLDAGAVVVGLTATPLGLGGMYEELIVAGTVSDGRECGALVWAKHFAPDEPDLGAIGKTRLTDRDLTEPEVRKLFPATQTLFGRVLENYRKLNPEGKPTILFASGVPESRWFAEQFCKAGIPAAHIDGDYVQMRWGDEYKADPRMRATLFAAFRGGEIKIVCNRFVAREGLDLPCVEHLILATVFDSLKSYLQSGGRGLRASPDTGKVRCVIQDHGGNYWRHGSLNADRHWHLSFGDGMMQAMRADRIREGLDREPTRCPRCAMVMGGTTCPGCGYEMQGRPRTRMVVQTDGSLAEQVGNVYRPRRRFAKPDALAVWTKCYWRAKKGGLTFKQAEGLFVAENRYWPPRTLPLMPKEYRDWFRLVSAVPFADLIPGRPKAAKADPDPRLFG